jgi:hypothetical protein
MLRVSCSVLEEKPQGPRQLSTPRPFFARMSWHHRTMAIAIMERFRLRGQCGFLSLEVPKDDGAGVFFWIPAQNHVTGVTCVSVKANLLILFVFV